MNAHRLACCHLLHEITITIKIYVAQKSKSLNSAGTPIQTKLKSFKILVMIIMCQVLREILQLKVLQVESDLNQILQNPRW
jgi:hypothetical protein